MANLMCLMGTLWQGVLIKLRFSRISLAELCISRLDPSLIIPFNGIMSAYPGTFVAFSYEPQATNNADKTVWQVM